MLWRMLLGALALFSLASQFPGAGALQITTPQPANPLGRALHICAVSELGFLQSANETDLSAYQGMGDVTADGQWLKPVIFSDALTNMNAVKGREVDVIKQLVGEYLGWTYEFHVYPSYSASFYHLSRAKCDVVWGSFNAYVQRVQCHAEPVAPESWGSVTSGCPNYLTPKNSTTTDSFWEAACCGTPLTPHLANGLSVIAEVTRSSNVMKMIDTVSSAFVVNFLLMQSVGIFLFGHLMWYLERWHEPVNGSDTPMFPKSLAQGGQEGVWWALVTMTTVGYGDITVKTGVPRVVAAIWMMLGFIAMACIIGALASGLSEVTVDLEVITPEGLAGVKTCTYTAYQQLLQSYGPILHPPGGTDNITQCWTMLKSGEVDAMVYEEKQAFAAKRLDHELSRFSVGKAFVNFWQGGLVSTNYANKQVTSGMNWAIGKMLDNEANLQAIDNRWMGNAISSVFDEENISTAFLYMAIAMWSLFIALQVLSINSPWTKCLRDQLPECNGLHAFLFGTHEERQRFAQYHSNVIDKWIDTGVEEPNDDDMGTSTMSNPHGSEEKNTNGRLNGLSVQPNHAAFDLSECTTAGVEASMAEPGQFDTTPELLPEGQGCTSDVRMCYGLK